MGKIILCIAASVDGFIADSAGSVDFLFEKPRVEPDTDYTAFYASVTSIVFGSASYRQIIEDYSPDKWPYPKKTCYVFSNSLTSGAPDVTVATMAPERFVREIARPAAGDCWLFGGQKLIRSFMDADLIDRYWIYVMPVILGAGVPLFSPSRRMDLTLVSVGKVDGIVKMLYNRDCAG